MVSRILAVTNACRHCGLRCRPDDVHCTLDGVHCRLDGVHCGLDGFLLMFSSSRFFGGSFVDNLFCGRQHS